jgi:hypothetical protein
MSNKKTKVGDLQEMSVNHSEPTGDNNMSVKNKSEIYLNETVNYSIFKPNLSILELQTDLSGQILENIQVVQIKLWGIKDQGLILKGTMTFHFYEENCTYSGILNNRNSSMLFNIWMNTGISEYVVEEIDNEYFVDVLWIKYMFTDSRIFYLKWINDCPEFRKLKLLD